jgi:hypothetical protein
MASTRLGKIAANVRFNASNASDLELHSAKSTAFGGESLVSGQALVDWSIGYSPLQALFYQQL